METYSSLWLFAAVAAITPGPNNIMIMTSGLNYGVRASLPHYLGICVGVPSMFLGLGFGLSYLFQQVPMVHLLVKVCGTSYLLYLAWKIANAAPASVSSGASQPLSFLQALLFQLINPKTWIMGTSAIAAYTTVNSEMSTQVLLIAFAFLMTAAPSVAAWMIFGVALHKLISKPNYIRVFNITMALLLVVSVVPIIMDLLETLI